MRRKKLLPSIEPKKNEIEEKKEAVVDIPSMVAELNPLGEMTGYSEERVDQLKLLVSYHKNFTPAEIKKVILPHVYPLFLKGFSVDEMSVAFSVEEKVIKSWIDSIREVNTEAIEYFDPLEFVSKAFDQFDMIYRNALEDYGVHKGSSTGNSFLKTASSIVNDKLSWADNSGLLDNLKSKANKDKDKDVENKNMLKSLTMAALSKIAEIQKPQLNNEGVSDNPGDKRRE
ncbi:hypothetical protein [Cognatishimia sp.]|uniref:hypothetical protein n=1 Tax=Cognatishimia sp. TaxID=2211648 RepID=UPI003511A828|nr:hypothetical protein [Cognatishimia sp.]